MRGKTVRKDGPRLSLRGPPPRPDRKEASQGKGITSLSLRVAGFSKASADSPFTVQPSMHCGEKLEGGFG